MRTKHDMRTLKLTALALLASIAGAALVTASAQQATFRDSGGRTTGTAATSGNMTTYRNSGGRTVGTGTTDSQGTTTFRDSSGRTTGTATHKVRTGPF
jgi:hypothetical protein